MITVVLGCECKNHLMKGMRTSLENMTENKNKPHCNVESRHGRKLPSSRGDNSFFAGHLLSTGMESLHQVPGKESSYGLNVYLERLLFPASTLLSVGVKASLVLLLARPLASLSPAVTARPAHSVLEPIRTNYTVPVIPVCISQQRFHDGIQAIS